MNDDQIKQEAEKIVIRNGDHLEGPLTKAITALCVRVRDEERERCAAIADQFVEGGEVDAGFRAFNIAAAIRNKEQPDAKE